MTEMLTAEGYEQTREKLPKAMNKPGRNCATWKRAWPRLKNAPTFAEWSNAMAEYDSPWKEALDQYFELFLAFFFPLTHADIAWNRGYEFLD